MAGLVLGHCSSFWRSGHDVGAPPVLVSAYNQLQRLLQIVVGFRLRQCMLCGAPRPSQIADDSA
jgi:hypothetical protein